MAQLNGTRHLSLKYRTMQKYTSKDLGWFSLTIIKTILIIEYRGIRMGVLDWWFLLILLWPQLIGQSRGFQLLPSSS